MKTVAVDPRMGASGDMILGALVDAGAERSALAPIEDAIDVHFEIKEVVEQGIASTDVTVHHHEHEHDHAEGAGPHRTYPEVIGLLEEMDLGETITSRAMQVFELLGEAEAAVHGTPLEDTHFHAVGADDAIADVTGTVALLADLEIDHVVTAPVSTGVGEIETSHGIYPIPPPAVVEIAERASLTLRGGPVEAELLTPTGAALLGALGTGVEQLPSIDIEAVGYGVGDHSFEGRPNVLRALVGETAGELDSEEITVLETNLDDATPEILGDLHERLGEAGALDVSVVPLTMKKARPGHLIRVIARPADEARIARRLAEETGTLGVRAVPSAHRWVANRSVRAVEVTIDDRAFEIDVKLAHDDEGTLLDVSAEFEDAASVADVTGLPVREIMRRAEAAVDRTGPGTE